MDKEIRSILKDKSEPIKSFKGLTLSQNDLILINDFLKKKRYSNVHFINWEEQNKNLIDENVELKSEINQQLVENMLRDNRLSIDLTKCQIDEDFLNCLANALEANRHIGALFLSQNDENRFEESDVIHRISKYLQRNNRDFRRFPSDYIHCLLASHCFSNRDKSIEEKVEYLGWKVEEELRLFTEKEEDKNDDKPNMYLSILYKNESTRQMVLAFRGIKLKVKDWYSQLESVANEVTSHSYYAYQHCTSAYEMSQKLGYNLSFTGYSFGSWLAQQSVYFCYKNYETRNVRAVAFDSPGSWDIIHELVDKCLDIRTFLFSPNFINTSNQHIGRVYRVFEKSINDDISDDFITNKFISKIPSESLRKMFEKWYEKIVKDDLIDPKYLFYSNGIRAMFSDDTKWLIDENFEIELKEVKRWPKIDYRPTSENLEEFNFAETALIITPYVKDVIPEDLKSILSMPIDAVLNRIIRDAVKHYFPSLAVIYNIIAEIPTGCLKDDQFLLRFEQNRVVLNEEPVLGKEHFDLIFGGCYEINKFDPLKDKLFLSDPTHLDNQIKSYFSDRNKLCNPKLEHQFRKLEDKLKIDVERDGVFYLKSSDEKVKVEVIRDRFFRLYEINELYERKYTNESTRNQGENHHFIRARNSSFIKVEKIFKRIGKILKKSQFCYLYGESGYGKTTLAFEYGYHIKDLTDQYIVHTIVSGNKTSNLNELASRFLDPISLKSKLDPEGLIRLIRNKIDSFETRIFFIFDDLTTFESVELILNNLNEHKFLFTTKNHSLFENNPEKGIELNGYDENWCVKYLKYNDVYSENESEQWKGLIGQCTNGKMSPQSLCDLICCRKQDRTLSFDDLEKILNGDVIKKYQFIQETNKLAFYMLQNLVFLDGNGIDFVIINEIFKKEVDFEESLDYLVEYGYLKKEDIDERTKFIIHESTQNEIENSIEESEKEIITLNIIKALNRMIKEEFETEMDRPKWDEKKLEKIKELEKHGNKIYKKFNNLNNREILIEFLKQLSKINTEILFNYYKVEEIKKFISNFQIITTPDIEASDNNIENDLTDQGNKEEEKENNEKCLNFEIETVPANNPETTISNGNKGNVLVDEGKYKEALEYFNKCLKIQLETLPENHSSIATSYNNIGNVLRYQGKYRESLKYYEKCLKIQQETLPANHPDIATSYGNIGIVLINQGKDEESLEYYEKSLKIRLESLPANHPSIATSYGNIGIVLSNQGRYKEALEYYEKCLKIQLETLPANDPRIAASFNNIGSVLIDQGKYEEAIEYYEKSLTTMKKTLPENHPDIRYLDSFIQSNHYKMNHVNKSSVCIII